MKYLITIMAATLAVSACDVPFEPFEDNVIGPFSVFGYLDLYADTQWIRVTPVRQTLLPDSSPIDAVVTLEHVVSGHVVTLQDSVFRFIDPGLGSVGYAHNFWTAEALEPGATYLFSAVRSDGVATTALVDMPDEFDITLDYFNISLTEVWEPRIARVPRDNLLYGDVTYTVLDTRTDLPAAPIVLREQPQPVMSNLAAFPLPGIGLFSRPDLTPFRDMFHREVRVVLTQPDWPFVPGLTPTHVAIPGAIPTNVENGVGAVVGIAMRTLPLPLCEPLEARLDHDLPCLPSFDASSVSVVGRIVRATCSNPRILPTLRLTERYAADEAVVWVASADWDGSYRFAGLQPGSELTLEFADDPGRRIRLPALGPGDRHVVRTETVPVGC